MENQQIIQFKGSEHDLDIHQVANDLMEHQDLWEDVLYEMIARERFGREGSCKESLVMVARPGQGQKMFEMAQDWKPYGFEWLNTDQKITLSLYYEYLEAFLERDFLFLTWRR